MTLKKNDIINLKIDSCSLSGSGIGRYEGMAVFVPASAAGDELLVHILKVKNSCSFGKIREIITPSADREASGCASFPRCGGCVFRHLSYAAETKIKYNQVSENLRRIGGIDIVPDDIVPADSRDRYRNKAQFPIASENGEITIGFYAPRSHRVIDCRKCLLQPKSFEKIIDVFARWIKENKISIYDETTGKGLLRHIFLRHALKTGEIAVCAVINSAVLPCSDSLVAALREAESQITSITVNINQKDTNVILGDRCLTLWGSDYITDYLCGLKFRISPLSFYQVNAAQAEKLYGKVREFAELSGTQTVLDLYCGTGTIGLTLASGAKEVIGVESISQAIEDAKINAADNGILNARFICGDAGEAALELKESGLVPDIIIVDPPRKGCSADTLSAVASMNPEKLIYVSCDSATLARDCALLKDLGYQVKRVVPVDMFPCAGHVECVVLMSKVQN